MPKPGESMGPKGDHNRRLALGVDADELAARAGITLKELQDYEGTWPDHEYDRTVAMKVAEVLSQLEANPPSSQRVINGPPQTP